MSLKHQAIRAIGWSLFDKVINQLGYLAVTVYIARLIGPESFGLIGMLTVFMLLADSIVNNGFSQALVQRSHQLTEDDANTIFYVNLCWGIFIYLALFTAAPWIALFYHKPELVDISRVLFLVILINSFTVVVRAKLIIKVDFKSQAIANMIANSIAAVLALIIAHKGYGLWSLVWLIIFKALFVSLVLWKFCRWIPKLSFKSRSFHTLFKFGSNLMFAGFVATVVNNLSIVLVGRYYNATQVGFFSQANNLSTYLYQFISSSIQGVTYPILTSIKEDQSRMISVYKKLISVSMLLCLPLMIGFAAVAEDFVYLFLGEEWLPTVPVLVALCVARTITPISAINMNILNVVGRSDLFLRVDLSKLPMTLGALYFALPFDINGLALATVITSFVAFFINAYYPGKMFGFGGVAQLRVAIPYIFATFVMYVLMRSLPWTVSIGIFLMKCLFGMLIYTLLLWLMRDQWLRQFVYVIRTRLF